MSLVIAPQGEDSAAVAGTMPRQQAGDVRIVIPAAPATKPEPIAGAERPPPARPREFAYKLTAALIATDWVVATTAIFAALSFREWQRAHSILDVGFSASFLLGWSAAAAVWFVWLMGLQRSYEIKAAYNIGQTLTNVFKAVCFWSLSIWAFVGLFRVTGFVPRLGAIYCMGTLLLFVGGWRLLSFLALKSPRVRRAASSRVLVVGWNADAAQMRDAMKLNVSLLGEVVGCVPPPDGRLAAEMPGDVPVLGDYASLLRLIEEQKISLLVLADTSLPPAEIQRLALLCERELIRFSLILDYFPAQRSRLHVQNVSGVPLLGRSQLPIDRTANRFIKRSIDIVGALVGLALSAFIVPWFCILVYLESPGPVIFRQRRTSRSGDPFHIYKIRSMKLQAEAGTGAVWCKENDDRRLRIGAFMRRWNIDELPQFINVLIGDMSLVGPRPERPELIARFKDEIPSYNLRHEVRTGLTGWAQIQGLRGNTDLRKRIEADLYYLENWSVALDFYCIAATFFRVKNAY
jgi:exopolysaccharide biosynthesis polyprenyl glycosylphosphotransferase